MAEDMLTDITLDHIPDLSDASISFQLPSASTELLLADQTDSFDLLRTADVVEDDDDLTSPPAAPEHIRAPSLTLADLTPRPPRTPRPLTRSRSPTPTRAVPSSAKPFVIQTPLGLGHDASPGKRRQPPSCIRASAAAAAQSVCWQLSHPSGSAEDGLEQLRIEVEQLSQPDVALPDPEAKLEQEPELASGPSHAAQHHPEKKYHLIKPQSPSRIITSTPGGPLTSEEKHRLGSLPHPTDHVEMSSDKDMVLDPTDDNGYPADATNVAQPKPRPKPKSRRNPRTNAAPNGLVHHAGITKQHRSVLPARHVHSKNITKNKASRVLGADQAHPFAVPKPTPPQSLHIDSEEEQLVPPASTSSGDIDTKPREAQMVITQTDPSGVAERLMSFSQKLMSSIGLGKQALPERIATCMEETASIAKPPVVTLEGAIEVSSRTRTQPPPASAAPLPQVPSSLARQHDVNDQDTPSTRREPLRLSEISPQKKPPSPSPPNVLPRLNFPGYSGAVVQDGRQHAMSPMRPAKKRLMTTLDADLPQEEGCVRKRGKTMPAASYEVEAEVECERGSSKEAVSQGYPHVEAKEKEKEKMSQDHEDEPLSRDETRRTSDNTRQRRGLGPCSSSTDKDKDRNRGKTTLPSARTKYKPKLDSSSGPSFGAFQRKGPTLHRFPYLVDGGLRQEHGPVIGDKRRVGGDKRAREEGEEGSKSSKTGRVARNSSASTSTSTAGSRFSASLRQRREKRRRQEKSDDNEAIAVRPSSPPWRHRDRNEHPRNQDDVDDDAMHDAVREQSGPVPPISTEVDLPFSEKKQNSTLLVPQAPQLTKPVAFTFRVDARLEARKMDERERERLASSEPGKPSHQAASVPFHGHASVPSMPASVPLPSHPPVVAEPFYFWTEQRAKERERFEEMVRRKEEEMVRLREEQRRVEAEKEEREIREMRRRAVPRANEVPEWYAGMPKRARKRVEEGDE